MYNVIVNQFNSVTTHSGVTTVCFLIQLVVRSQVHIDKYFIFAVHTSAWLIFQTLTIQNQQWLVTKHN